MLEENHTGKGYFERAGVSDWQDWQEKLGTMDDKLKAAIDAAQPFVEEDLSFLWTLKGGNHVARSHILTDAWKPSEKSSYKTITKAQQDILRGKIKFKKK